MIQTEKKFWSGGVSWSDKSESKLEEFKSNNYWKIGWPKNAYTKGANQAWENIAKIQPNDYFAFHGYGGRNDLTIYQISKVVKIDKENGIVYLQRLNSDSDKLFHDKAPKMEYGSWFGTLFQVTGNEAINAIFGNFIEKDSE